MYLRSLANSIKATRLPQRLNVVRVTLPASALRFSQTRSIAFRASPFRRNQYTLPDGNVVTASTGSWGWRKTLGGLIGLIIGAGAISFLSSQDEKADNELAEQYVQVLRKVNRGDVLNDEELAVIQSIASVDIEIPSIKTLILAAKLIADAEDNGYIVPFVREDVERLLNWAGNDEEEEIALRLLRVHFGSRCYSRHEVVNDIEYLEEKMDALSPKDIALLGFSTLSHGKNPKARSFLTKAGHPAAKVVANQQSFDILPSLVFSNVHLKSGSKEGDISGMLLHRTRNYCSLYLPASALSFVGMPRGGVTLQGYSTANDATLFHTQHYKGAAYLHELHLTPSAFDGKSWVGTWSVKRLDKDSKAEDAPVVSTVDLTVGNVTGEGF